MGVFWNGGNVGCIFNMYIRVFHNRRKSIGSITSEIKKLPGISAPDSDSFYPENTNKTKENLILVCKKYLDILGL